MVKIQEGGHREGWMDYVEENLTRVGVVYV